MLYKRGYKNKKRTYRPGYKACGTMVLSDAQRALVKVSQLKSLLNVEYKHHNISSSSTAITDAGIITNVSSLNEGVISINWDGGQVKWTSFRFAYHLGISASAFRSMVRIMVVHDKQTNQAQFTLADLLFDATIVDAINSPYNINNASRFNVLYDKKHVLTDNGANQLISRLLHKKLNIKMRYDADAGTVADQSQDSISLVFISNEVTNDPTITFNYRARFIDN